MQIEGLDDLIHQIRTLPEKTTRRTLLKIIRRVTKPVVNAARHEVAQIQEKAFSEGRHPTGNLYESIGNITGKSQEYPNIQVGARVKRRYKGFHAHLLHDGTGKRMTKRGYNRGAITRPIPFMQRAFDKTHAQVRPHFENEVAKEVKRIVKKNIKPTV